MTLAYRVCALLATLLLASGLAHAQQWCTGSPVTTPDAHFADAGNGTVTHTPTGLIWKRCAEGQTWNGSTCTGSAATYTWQQAFARADEVNAGTGSTQNAGQSDWRLPNRNELSSIVEQGCTGPSINLTQFPATIASGFWSASPYAGDLSMAWYANFGYGHGMGNYRNSALKVRLVRGGANSYNFDAGDTTPNAFDVSNLTNQTLSTVVTTGAIPVAGIDVTVTATTTVGTIVKNGIDTVAGSAAVVSGDTVAIKLTTSASQNTTITGTLTIGTGATSTDNFSVTTIAAAPVNAACGTVAATSFKPATGLCASGTMNAAGVSAGSSAWTWACDGSGGGTSTAANACSAAYAPTATSSGGAASQVSGGAWVFAASGTGPNQTGGFIPTSGNAKSPAAATPAGYTFPHGLFDFVLTGGVVGTQATITLTYPTALPAGTVYWKYGPTAGNPVNHWYQFPAVIAGNTITLTLTDNLDGDDAYTTASLIVDAGGPGVPGGVADIPTLSEWALLLLSLLLAALARAGRGRLGI